MQDSGEKQRAPRSLQLAIFAVGLLWLLAARAGAASAAQGISHLLGAFALRPLLEEIFLLVLLLTGFTVLNWLGMREGSVRASNALPWRATAVREWQKGAALGWALLLVCVLPMAVAGDLHPQFSLAGRFWGYTLLSLATVLVGSLATEVAFRGFLYRRLIDAAGQPAATVLLSTLYALLVTSRLNTTRFSFAVAFISGLLFSLAYLRTHGLWLGWGLRFGWLASMGVLFGLPLAGSADLASVVATDSSGGTWLTGGPYGPEGAVFTALVLLAGAIALYPLTREYAWDYTQPVIVPGGYAMNVPPPAAHEEMERAAGTQLVQILGAPPPPPPPPPVRPVPMAPAPPGAAGVPGGFSGPEGTEISEAEGSSAPTSGARPFEEDAEDESLG